MSAEDDLDVSTAPEHRQPWCLECSHRHEPGAPCVVIFLVPHDVPEEAPRLDLATLKYVRDRLGKQTPADHGVRGHQTAMWIQGARAMLSEINMMIAMAHVREGK